MNLIALGSSDFLKKEKKISWTNFFSRKQGQFLTRFIMQEQNVNVIKARKQIEKNYKAHVSFHVCQCDIDAIDLQ